MNLDTVEKVLRRYGRNRIDWYNWGEPLLHKEFASISGMIRRTHSSISSNFSLKLPNEYFDALQNFKKVVVSMSGITPEVYKLYHTAGNFDLVMSNIKNLANKKKTRLIIRWLAHKDNADQYIAAEKYFGDMGYEVEYVPLNCEVEELIGGFEHPYLRSKRNNDSAYFNCSLIKRPTIDVDGQHLLCCASHNVPLHISVDENISDKELINIKMKTDLCQACQAGEHWRMF
jgi:sulfatase maturation enzyme AslB (radical SAM superfamily)